MKIVDQFINKSITKKNGRYLVRKSALSFLKHRGNYKGHLNWIVEGQTGIKLGGFQAIKCSISSRYSANKFEGLDIKHEIKENIVFSLRNVHSYYYDFLSYRMPSLVAMRKAETLCLMYAIKPFLKASVNPQIILRVINNQSVHGELETTNSRKFYQQVNWLMRIGIFHGILLSKLWQK